MSRYIDADKIIYTWLIDNDGKEHDGVTLQSVIDMMPTADVRENVKGEWLPHPNKDFREWDVCSACGVGCKRREYELGIAGMEYMTEYNYPYCPNCGAKMERGRANENNS